MKDPRRRRPVALVAVLGVLHAWPGLAAPAKVRPIATLSPQVASISVPGSIEPWTNLLEAFETCVPGLWVIETWDLVSTPEDAAEFARLSSTYEPGQAALELLWQSERFHGRDLFVVGLWREQATRADLISAARFSPTRETGSWSRQEFSDASPTHALWRDHLLSEIELRRASDEELADEVLFREIDRYTLLTADESVTTSLSRSINNFGECPAQWGPSSPTPNEPKCHYCCDEKGAGCDGRCAGGTAVISVAGCGLAALVCGGPFPQAIACCGLGATLIGAAHKAVCEARCGRRKARCHKDCVPD